MTEFWYGRAEIPVKKNYTLGYKKNQKKIFQKRFEIFVFKIFFFKAPEFWYGCARIPVEKNYTLGYEKRIKFLFSNISFQSA